MRSRPLLNISSLSYPYLNFYHIQWHPVIPPVLPKPPAFTALHPQQHALCSGSLDPLIGPVSLPHSHKQKLEPLLKYPKPPLSNSETSRPEPTEIATLRTQRDNIRRLRIEAEMASILWWGEHAIELFGGVVGEQVGEWWI